MTTLQDRILEKFRKQFLRTETDMGSNGQFVDEVIGKLPEKLEQFLLTSITQVQEETRREIKEKCFYTIEVESPSSKNDIYTAVDIEKFNNLSLTTKEEEK